MLNTFRAKTIRVPLLSEVLELFPDTVFQIELKDNSITLAQAVLEIISELNAWKRTQIASAHTNLIRYINLSEPRAALAHSAVAPLTFVICAALKQRYCPRFHTGFIDLLVQFFRFPTIIAPAIRAARKQGLKVRAFTVNDLVVMKTLSASGVQGFFTEYPSEARQLSDTINRSQIGDVE